MSFRLMTDLSQWPNHKLMHGMRNQFAYSVALFILVIPSAMISIYNDRTSITEHSVEIILGSLFFFLACSMVTWFTFIRLWREMNRRLKNE